MHKIWIIARREYLERIRTRNFAVMTLLIPLLMFGLVYGSRVVSGRANKAERIAIVAEDQQFGQQVADKLLAYPGNKAAVEVHSRQQATHASLDARLKDKSLDAYLWVVSSPAGINNSFAWVSNNSGDQLVRNQVTAAIGAVQLRQRLTRAGITSDQVEAMLRPVTLLVSSPVGQESAGDPVSTAYALFFLMYFVIVTYCMNIGRSIIEDKTSRIFEVMLATVRPAELMAGKLLGVGSVGLTQVGIWIVAGLAIARYQGYRFPLNPVQLVCFVVFFTLGYLLYSGVASALGAMVNSQQELQQMNIFMMLPLIACNGIIVAVVNDPDGAIAKAFSFFPFTTPLIMYVRIAVKQPPVWQILLAVGEMALTTAAIVWIASRIYRVGILMYGKKPGLAELLRWMRYS